MHDFTPLISTVPMRGFEGADSKTEIHVRKYVLEIFFIKYQHFNFLPPSLCLFFFFFEGYRGDDVGLDTAVEYTAVVSRAQTSSDASAFS